jgi:putative FmdB family regulatory protein
MPTYGYRCKNGHEFEVVQTFAEAPLKRCTICGAKVNRIFYPVGIVFKGPGFYATDSRSASGASASAGRPDSDGASGAKPDTKTEGAEVKAKPESRGQGKGQGKNESKSKREGASGKT